MAFSKSNKRVKNSLACAALIAFVGASDTWAGFLEMPDTTQVPEMERESLLKDLDIPSVRERDPDPMSGPRLNITEFRVQGIVEYPELGITREALHQMVEGIRFEIMSEGELLESGYTLEEVAEISDMMVDIERSAQGAHVGPEEVQRLVFLIRDLRRRRGVTVGMIETVADHITQYYRERGFILAKAYIPEQRVRDGVVTLTLLLGELGDVDVHNNRGYRDSTITKIFNPAVGKPVRADQIEQRLLFVNDLPGLSAQAYFEPGLQVGDTHLSVNVIEETRFNGNFRVDNHGSSNTGEYRLYMDGYWQNPTGLGDQLHIGVLGTFEPSNSLYGSIHYGIPLFSPRANFTVGGSTNDFVSTSLSGLTLTGKSSIYDGTLNFILARSRVRNFSTELRVSQVETEIEAEGDFADDIDFDSTVRNLDLVFNFDVLQERARALHNGGVRLTVSEYVEGMDDGQEDNPLLLAFNYSFVKFLNFPFTQSQTRFMLNIAGQYTDTSLPSTSQFSLAGPNRMRAFDVNEFNSDSGGYLGVDWIFNGPSFMGLNIGGDRLNEMIQPYVFANAGYGHQYSAARDGPPTWGHLTDVGLGLKLSFRQSWRGSVSYAKAVSFERDLNVPNMKRQNLSDLGNRDNVYFSLQYSY